MRFRPFDKLTTKEALCFISLLTLSACYQAQRNLPPPPQITAEEAAKEESQAPTEKAKPPVEAKAPAVPWGQDHPALRQPTTISAFNLPLGNALQSLIGPTRLNLEVKEGVDLSKTVTVKAARLLLGRVLLSMLAPLGYGFKVEGDTLIVFETDTLTFRIPIAELQQSYSSTVSNQTSIGQTGTGGTTGTSGTTGTTGGSYTGGTSASGGTQGGAGTTFGTQVTVQSFIDKASIWDNIDANLKSMVARPGFYSIDRISGTATVTAKASALKNIARYMDYLKSEYGRQARFDVQVLEVTLTGDNQWGVDWTRIFNNLIAHNDIALRTAGALAQGLDLTLPAFTLTSRDKASNLIINALKKQGNVKLLSQPKILVRNNTVAAIAVGTVIPYVGNITTILTQSQSATTPSVSTVQTGVTLSILPKINPDRSMSIHLVPVITKLVKLDQFNVAGSTLQAPELDTRTLSTTVNSKDGETIVLGGLITRETNNDTNSIPLLGDIPLLGYLASNIRSKESRSELVIIMTPKVEIS